MLKPIGVIVLLASVVACAPGISREAAQIAYHHDMSTMLDDCERLGPVTVEIDSTWLTPDKNEAYQAARNLNQAALDKYGTEVDNVALINTVKVHEGKNTVFAKGAAFKCNT